MIQQDYLEIFWRTWVFADKDIARMRVTVHKSVLKDHVCKNLYQSFANQLSIKTHRLNLLLFCNFFAFDEVHDDDAV